MTRGNRAFLMLAGTLAVLLVGSGLAIAAGLAYGGVITVRVHDAGEGLDLYLPLPGVVAEAGAGLAAITLPAEAIDEVRAQLGPHGPLIRDLLAALEDIPDTVLVEVHDGEQNVVVRKEGGSLFIEVREPGTHVEVTVPLRAVRRSAEYLFA